MNRRLLSERASRWVISMLLLALVVRALIPAGFMPAMDRAFSFQICPDGFPAQLLAQDQAQGQMQAQGAADEHAAHHHHAADHAGHHNGPDSHHDASRTEHCVFAAVASTGPAPTLTTIALLGPVQAAPSVSDVTPVYSSQRYRAQQPRAPPRLA